MVIVQPRLNCYGLCLTGRKQEWNMQGSFPIKSGIFNGKASFHESEWRREHGAERRRACG